MAQKDHLVVECDCGCGTAYSFDYLDGTIFIKLLVGYHGVKQFHISSFLREKFRLLGRKERWVDGAILDDEDVAAIIKYLEDHPCNNEKVENCSYMRLSHVEFGDDVVMPDDHIDQYDLTTYCTMSRFDIVRGKEYRAGAICLNEELRQKYLRHLKKVYRLAKKRS